MVGKVEKGSGFGWKIARWAVGAIVLLLIPLIAMQLSNDWDWGVFDFVFIFILLFGMGVIFELVARKADSIAYKAGVGLAVLTALFLVWVNAAVGIIGDDEAINLLYFGVLIIGLLGAILARFEAQGMARTMYAMAVAQMLVPVIAFVMPSTRDLLMEPPGVLGVFALLDLEAGVCPWYSQWRYREFLFPIKVKRGSARYHDFESAAVGKQVGDKRGSG